MKNLHSFARLRWWQSIFNYLFVTFEKLKLLRYGSVPLVVGDKFLSNQVVASEPSIINTTINVPPSPTPHQWHFQAIFKGWVTKSWKPQFFTSKSCRGLQLIQLLEKQSSKSSLIAAEVLDKWLRGLSIEPNSISSWVTHLFMIRTYRYSIVQ